MAVVIRTQHQMKVADEVFLVVATLHHQNPEKEEFTVQEILSEAERLKFDGEIRPGFQVHVRQHCVANLKPNPGDYRMVFATGKSSRRLLKKSDEIHPQRKGKMFPELKDVDPMYFGLITWAKQRYEASGEESELFADFLALHGSSKGLWKDEPADEYIARLRGDWD